MLGIGELRIADRGSWIVRNFEKVRTMQNAFSFEPGLKLGGWSRFLSIRDPLSAIRFAPTP